MSNIYSNKHKLHLTEDEPPEKKLISDGDLFIKDLLNKQQNKTASLRETLIHPKEFVKSSEIHPIHNYTLGLLSFEELQKVSTKLTDLDVYQSAKLSKDEIDLLSEYKLGGNYVFDKHKNLCKLQILEKIHDIQTKLNKGIDWCCPDEVSNNRTHKNDLALCLKPDSIETKLLKFAINRQAKSDIPQSFDKVKEIEEELNNKINNSVVPSISKIRRKARKLANRVRKNSKLEDNRCTKAVSSNILLPKESKWDVKHQVTGEKLEKIEPKQYTCTQQNFYTIVNGQIVKLSQNISGHKLTIEDIRKIPHFKNYEIGSPSKKLYIKNLRKSIKEDDLRVVFNKYESKSNLKYDILNGRLRGQAFITFPDEMMAKDAIENINGTLLDNKPIVIQFSYKK